MDSYQIVLEAIAGAIGAVLVFGISAVVALIMIWFVTRLIPPGEDENIDDPHD